MDRHLNLVDTDYHEVEKRVLPRFPFSFLVFKEEGCSKSKDNRTFEVKDISFKGMQLVIKDGEHLYKTDDEVTGTLQWMGYTLNLQGKVKWIHQQRLGVAFKRDDKFDEAIREFLSVEHIVAGMRPIHKTDIGIELPANLKYWLRADGPVELFVWQHSDGELAKFQIIIMKNFIEWEDGKGIVTGKLLTMKDVDTPLIAEDEFVFEMDEGVDMEKISMSVEIVSNLPKGHLPEDAIDFIKVKLGR